MWGLVALLFFFSGATSLVYETLWIRVLSLGVGSTSAAMSLVLALFFLGLSLGSWLSSRHLTKIGKPLLIYAVLEGVIGLVGLVLIYGLIHFQSLLAFLPLTGSFSWVGTLTKFFLTGLLLSIPTVAMGATLPLIVQLFDLLPTKKKGAVGLLYAINTFGGVFGTLFASFVLIPKTGILVTNAITAVTNIALFGLAYWLHLRLTSKKSLSIAKVAEPVPLTRYQWGLVALSGVCGFSSLASEVVWNKYLGIFLGNNIYGLGIVLGIYLLGIALGSLILHFLMPRLRKPENLFWLCLLALPVLFSLTSYLFNWVPFAASVVGYYTSSTGNLLFIKCLFSGMLLLPTTILLGALFPLTVHLISPNRESEHFAVGLAYTVNTVGAILGSCVSGLILMPHIGSSNTIRISTGLLAVATLALLFQAPSKKLRKLTAIPVVGLLAVIFLGDLDFRNIIKSAYVQKIDSEANLTQTLKYFSKGYEEFLWTKEGETSVITLSHDPKDGEYYKNYLRLKTNGLNESVYQKGKLEELPRYEALLGLLPYLFSDNPQNAFIVGYGGGYTVDLMTSFPLKKVNVVELEQAIMDAADYAHGNKNDIRKRPNLDLTIEDARFVLAAKLKAPLDIIVSQPSHSWLAGAANLFTKEFFQIVRGNLSEKGIYSQWLNLYNMDTGTLKSILRTFYEVFPYGAVFSGQGDQEMILLGSSQPLKYNSKEAERLAHNNRFQKRLAGVPFSSSSDVIAHFALSRETILAITEGAPINTDINAYAETRQSKHFYTGVPAEENPQAYLTANYKAGFASLLDGSQDWAYSVLVSLNQTGQHEKFFQYLTEFEKEYGGKPERHSQLGYLCLKAQRYDSARKYLESAYKQDPSSTNLNLLVSVMNEMGQYKEAIRVVDAKPQLKDKISECYWVHSHLGLNNLEKAKPVVDRMIRDINGYTRACGDFFNRLVGDYYYQKRDYKVAIPFYQAYNQNYSSDVRVLQRLSVAYLSTNEWANASELSNYLSSLVDGERKQIQSLAEFYRSHELNDDAQALTARLELMAGR